MMIRISPDRIGVAILIMLVITADRSPAPVLEEPDKTPIPSATATKLGAKTQRAARKAEAKPKPTATAARQSRFAGTWIGTMQTFPAGNQSTVITINTAETTMTVEWFGKHDSAKAEIEGGTVRATFPPPQMQPETHKWALTPLSDGKTANVHFRCFMNDFTAVFHRAGSDG